MEWELNRKIKTMLRSNIYQTRGTVFHQDIQTEFFNNFEVFGYPDETLFRVIDVTYQTRGRVLHEDIQTPRSCKKTRPTTSFFNTLLGREVC